MRKLASFLMCLAIAGCDMGGGQADAAPADAAVLPDATQPSDKAANCASTFGSALTLGFGRIDGTVRAVVPPGHPTCALPNGDHMVVQVDFGGQTYRAVINVMSDQTLADPNVRLDAVDAPLPSPAFADGWHISSFDYVASLAQHSTAFVSHPEAELVQLVTDQIEIGAPVSIYSSVDSTGASPGASSHLVHRNPVNEDGAIVIRPTTAPHFLLFAFSNQSF